MKKSLKTVDSNLIRIRNALWDGKLEEVKAENVEK